MNKRVVPIVAAAIFFVLLVVSVYQFFFQSTIEINYLIAKEVKHLAKIFERIDKECKILDIHGQKNVINFLNVKRGGFAGSEVGPLNLTYPENWDGPYLQVNPTIEGIEYQLVHIKKEYFVVPGDGVKLSNGKVIGKDIILDEHANIPLMMQDPDALGFEGGPLAAPIKLGISKFKEMLYEDITEPEEEEYVR